MRSSYLRGAAVGLNRSIPCPADHIRKRTTLSLRPISPYQLLRTGFFYFWNPYPTFPGGVHELYRLLYTWLGRPYRGFPDFGYLHPFRTQAPNQLF